MNLFATPGEGDLVIHVDGGSRGNPGPAGAGVVIALSTQGGSDPAASADSTEAEPVFEGGFFIDHATNNVAEYTGLIRALEEAQRRTPAKVSVFADSQLMVRQITGQYRVKNATLKPLWADAMKRLGTFPDWSITHVYREANERADQLANMAMDLGEDVVVTNV